MGTEGVGAACLCCTYSVYKQTTAVNVVAEMQFCKKKFLKKIKKAKKGKTATGNKGESSENR